MIIPAAVTVLALSQYCIQTVACIYPLCYTLLYPFHPYIEYYFQPRVSKLGAGPLVLYLGAMQFINGKQFTFGYNTAHPV